MNEVDESMTPVKKQVFIAFIFIDAQNTVIQNLTLYIIYCKVILHNELEKPEIKEPFYLEFYKSNHIFIFKKYIYNHVVVAFTELYMGYRHLSWK